MPDRQSNKVTVRDWRSEVRKAEAASVVDQALVGVVMLEGTRPPVVYTFSNGRQFRDGHGPYEE